MAEHILDVAGLKTYFSTSHGIVKAVDGIDLKVKRGEILSLVGETGCGKSVTARSIMRLIDAPGKIVAGKVCFDGQDLLRLSEREMTRLRGERIAMIFQQPVSHLTPVFSAGSQIAEVLAVHRGVNRQESWERALALMRRVGLSEAHKKARAYPHQLSGGQAQRVMIAIALACAPELLIADEPTTALDVTIQAQILDLMLELQQETGTAIILITHDLGVVAEMAERVAVMYAGRIVEQADVGTVLGDPLHPYTQGLIASVPVMGHVRARLSTIPGSVPNLIDLPPGCKFAPRCQARVKHGLTLCTQQEPPLQAHVPGHVVRCWLYAQAQPPDIV